MLNKVHKYLKQSSTNYFLLKIFQTIFLMYGQTILSQVKGLWPKKNFHNTNYYILRDYLYLGGHPEDISDITGARFQQGFDGCITNIGIIHYNKKNTNPPKYGLPRIPFNKQNYFLEQSNVKCVKVCRV